MIVLQLTKDEFAMLNVIVRSVNLNCQTAQQVSQEVWMAYHSMIRKLAEASQISETESPGV